MNSDLKKRYAFFKEHAGYIVGEAAACALSLARAEQRGEELGLVVSWEDEFEPFDGECDAPNVYLCAIIRDRNGRVLGSLGGIGLDSTRDPYMRVVAAELCQEAWAVLNEENREFATDMAMRATYAG